MTTYARSRAVSRPALVDRVVVNGTDITWLRGKHIPVPKYTLSEPLAYGSSLLSVPQIHGGYEQLGVGDLAWAKRGAVVLYQRCDPDTGAVAHTDYVGRIIDINIDGSQVSFDIGGQIAGPATLIYVPPPRFRKVRDVGRWVWNACNDVRVNLEPYGGPATGIKIPGEGAMSLLAWVQKLGALSQSDTGIQRALMPTVWGGVDWEFTPKDNTTVDLVAFNDDARVVLKVSDAASEDHNVFFGTGVTPQGVRIFNGRYPGMQQGDPPPYPMAGGVDFGIGTTDADTITGDGMTIMYSKLVTLGYLTAFDFAGVYTTAIAVAVKRLQDDAGYAQTGTMTTASWNALYDIDITGYSYLDARVFPMAIDPKVQPWHYTPEGNYLDRNDAYDPLELRSDRPVDFGAGLTKTQMLAWARGYLNRSATTKNWAGTLTLNGTGVFDGTAHGVDPALLTEAHMVPADDIRPGMNVWLPMFDGGTLFHIAGVDRDRPNNTTDLTIDTRARDLLEVSEIIARNRESRRDIRREWMAANMGAKPSGNMVARDEFFGQLFNNVTLVGNGWTVVPVVLGQSGQVNQTVIQLTNSPAAFVMGVWSRTVTAAQLNRRIPNPLAVYGDDDVPWFEDEGALGDWFDNRILLYAAGDFRDPCGYAPRKHTSDNGITTSAPITGLWRDQATWSYLSGPEEMVVAYVGIYADRASRLNRGQLFWAQEDDVN